MPKLLECYIGLLKMNCDAEDSHFSEIADRLYDTLEQYGIYLAEYLSGLTMMLAIAAMDGRNGEEEYRKIEQIVEALYKLCGTNEQKQIIDYAIIEMNHQRIDRDPRIGDTLTCAYEVYFGMDDEEPQLRKSGVTILAHADPGKNINSAV